MPRAGSYAYLGGADRAFSRKMGARGWIGMCWPKAYGGGEHSMLERYVVAEEMLVARAPLGAHWIGDRQAGPLLLKFGTEAQRRMILPRITAGECRFCIGMSEPHAGSDLAAVSTSAVRVEGGFTLSGSKLWTSSADQSDYMIVLCRTAPRAQVRQECLSQLILDLRLPGIRIKPIRNMVGEHDFFEVFFDEVFVPESALVGQMGAGWKQVNSELAFERAGPERYLSSFGLIGELVEVIGRHPSAHSAIAVGRLTAHLAVVRRLSCSVATMQQTGDMAAVQAAVVKDIGTSLEQEIGEVIRGLFCAEPDFACGSGLAKSLGDVLLRAPSYTIRGGTREVLRGIIAKGLGV
jgi:alkylation response protein AidB-like acyl-CoA dehydrogenase